jgi:hypothetical protein
MTKYNNNRFTPGSKANLRLFINKAYIRQYYQAFNTSQTFDNINNADDITQGTLCGCITPRATSIKQGWNDPSQTENIRISQAITGTLGGKITYGNFYKPVTLNYLGGWEGQPGGSPRPLRNRF